MLIRRSDLDRIVSGEIDTAFRRWKRPTVKTGGTLTTAVGVLAIDDVSLIDERSVTDSDAERAGFESREALLSRVSGRSGDLYRIRLRWKCEDPRVQLRERADLSDRERAEIRARLDRYDRASRSGPWTDDTLRLIRRHPSTLAATLAERGGRDTAAFKRNVRKLKAMGLTESLEIGYRLSRRGAAFLEEEDAP